MTKVHILKTWPVYYADIADGPKRFEYRKNDRDFQVGDALMLKEWDPDEELYTGNEMGAVITYVLREAPGLPEGYAVLGIDVVTLSIAEL
jgi:hypothetical protein